MTILPVVYAAALTAILIAPALHVLGFSWRAALLSAVFVASAVGWSAISAIGLL